MKLIKYYFEFEQKAVGPAKKPKAKRNDNKNQKKPAKESVEVFNFFVYPFRT